MGRAPCCDKANVKRGPWSPEEDSKLKSYIDENGTGGNWIALPQKIGLKRCGKSCRLRWLNYLRPNIKHGGFSEEEDNIICNLYISIGSRWSIIAAQLPGRTDNDIKNYWNTRLKKKLLGKQRKEHQSRRVNAHLKQEMMKKAGNDVHFMMNTTADNNNKTNGTTHQNHPQNLYFPQPAPTAAPQLDSALNDHTSIRKLLIKLGGRFSDIQDHHLQQGLDNNKLKNISFYTPTQDIPSTQQVYGGHDPHNPSMDWFSSSMNYSTINTNNNSSCADELLLNNSYDIVDDDGMNMHDMLVSDDGLNSCFPIDHEHLGDDDHSMPALCRNTKMESSSVIDHYDQAGSSSTELLYGSSSMAMENESSSSTPGTHIDITKPSSSGGNGNSWVHVDRHMRPFMYPNTIPTVNTTTGFGSSQQQPPPQQQRVLQEYGLN
ncbi:hypothetical protein C5167_009933 [Papaver somniferum]|uniref:Uncharacterized protein n=1 Tax=Papaver somniferum TaxID=3469 RepID=A0A4Y7K1V1_PAPSO|nr:transcription factor RAX3-like [Papaver somniferum]RZC66241.1 hypothetical protein C5167_009933 [Papaver somniferum]